MAHCRHRRLDGEARADLIWRNDAIGETALWLMNGLASNIRRWRYAHPHGTLPAPAISTATAGAI